MAASSVSRCAFRTPWLVKLPAQQLTSRLHFRGLATAAAEPRVAIVTGSARGIGKAVAVRLARDGFNVCINDVPANKKGIDETVSEIKSLGGRAVGIEADVTSYDQVQDMVQKTVKELGPLTTMIANAGIVQVRSILELTEEDYERMFRVNVFGVQHCFKAAALQIISQGNAAKDRPAKLIAAASIAAFKPWGMLTHYCAAKAAVVSLTHNYAVEMAEHDITVNNYCPGIVGTDMWDLIDKEVGKMRGGSMGEAIKKGEILKKYSDELISLGRTSVVDDVSKAVGFLAGPDSDYMTGQSLVVDGGIVFR